MIEADQVPDFVQRDGADRRAVERLAASVMKGEDDVGLHDPPVVVVRPQRLAADLLVEANIVLAIHHRGGEPLDTSAVRAIALHEVGHLIGLDHTSDAANIMTPKVRVKELSDADIATARLLYALPAGKVK